MKLTSLVCETTLYQMVAVASATPPGCFVEVGVYQGGSAQRLAELAEEQQRQIYLYDTFTGIPNRDDAHDQHKVGDFSETSFEQVKSAIPYAHVIAGIFPQSAVHMGPIAFAHVDCDQYRAVKETAQYLDSLMVPGGVIWFDDYPILAGAKQAVEELYAGRLTNIIGCDKWWVKK
jgi:hypothetical protein